MDVKVAGVGSVPNGDYNHVSASGNVELFGLVKCKSIVAKGKIKGESLECQKSAKLSGNATFSGKVTAQELKASGKAAFGGDAFVKKSLRLSGNVKCTGDMKAEDINSSGALSVGGDMDAEKLKIKGALHCEGFIHAKETDIRFNSKTRLGTVNSSKVAIRLKTGKKILQCVYLFPLFIKKLRARTIVNMGISGDDVQVEHIVCPRVTGKKVRIGRGCKIDLVEYSEEIKISKNSKVGKVEKI